MVKHVSHPLLNPEQIIPSIIWQKVKYVDCSAQTFSFLRVCPKYRRSSWSHTPTSVLLRTVQTITANPQRTETGLEKNLRGRLSLSRPSITQQQQQQLWIRPHPARFAELLSSCMHAYLKLLSVSQRHFKAILKMLQTGFGMFSNKCVCKVLHCVHVCAQATYQSKGSQVLR